ncbi:hypothetical protein LPY66_08835 [Dehalobacter sp. DCM]|uniref:hypothetical protein n=1 Tax=Dehalobacter sp. DCM TaxID=2907827 RepID=UPI0030813C1E|nr:hypothetical protein LPY66_08835 [Dehalobacter sp. DCM]
MAKLIIIRKRVLVAGILIVLVAALGLIGTNLLRDSEVSTTPTSQVDPEIKIINIDFEPQIVIRDLSYDGEVFKGVQTLNKTDFKISAIIQNTTENTMTNIPVIMTITSLDDKSKTVTKEGSIPILEPGATAKIAYENIKALGNAQGESATAGQHEMVLTIKSNPQGAVTQSTEARVIFNVDSSVKS